MERNAEEIEFLIVRYLQNTCTEEERKTLVNWLNESSENEKEFFQIKELFDSRLRSSVRMVRNDEIWEQLVEKYNNPDPLLVRKTSIVKKRLIEWSRYAAIIIVTFGISLFYFNYSNKNNPGAKNFVVKQLEIHNARGVHQVILPDCTKVWLHGGTTIKYPEQFTSSSREIELDGEAYFDVHSNKKNPFIVRTNIASICATGTEFNVTAYSKDDMAITTLVEGIVDVRTEDETHAIRMQPGQQAIVLEDTESGTSLKVGKIDPELYIDWKDGIYRFKKEPFERIVLQLEKMYGINITIETKTLRSAMFSGMFTEEHSLREALEIINMSTPIRYSIKGKDVYIKEYLSNKKQ